MTPTLFLTLISVLIALISAELTPNYKDLSLRPPMTRPLGIGDHRPIIQMFQWNWESIAHECATWLHKTGYGYVQISPPQEHIQGPQWWTDYQPVSYKLISKRGNSLQFQKMVKACHGSNIKIITDTIWNHMAGIDGGIGVGGTNFSHYNYPGIYGYSDFHHCGLNPGDDIVNNTNRFEVQNCELMNLADLATGTEVVRGTLADYADTLIYLGADGLRLDAAKLIPADDIHAILAHMKNPPSIVTQEVIWGAQEEIQPTEYLQNGKVHEFRYSVALHDAFMSGNLDNLTDIDQRGWLPSNQSNVFVANHDTERSGISLNYTSPNNIYALAHIFMFAYPYGHPTVLSSYIYNTSDDGAPLEGYGSCNVTTGWLCQHRLYAGMVSFYNYVNRNGTYEPITNYISPSPDMIAFGRGSVGHVVINSGPRKWNTTFKTNLPDGTYCDVVEKPMFSTECSDASYTVLSGEFNAVVPPASAMAIHTGAMAGQVFFIDGASPSYSLSLTLIIATTTSISFGIAAFFL